MIDYWILGRPIQRRSTWFAVGLAATLFCQSTGFSRADGKGGDGGGITGGTGGSFGQVGGDGGTSGGGGGGGSGASGGSGDNGATMGGSAGNPTGSAGQSGIFSGGGGGGGANGFNTSGTIVTTTPLAGGAGGNGGDAADEGAGGGGAGGYGAVVGGSGLSTTSSPALTIAGGDGGRGGDSIAGFGGGGGEGGVGISFSAAGVQYRNSASANVRGGAGGEGGFALNTTTGNTGGAGGTGGSALLFSGSGAVFDNTANVVGGVGGRGGDGVTGIIGGAGRGGDGGIGAHFTAAGAQFRNSGAGSVRGGDAGRGGNSFSGMGGDGGIGGVGVRLSGASAIVDNSATIQGGIGGEAGFTLGTGGTGGIGVQFVGSGGMLTNSGTIVGGNGGPGATTLTSGLGGVAVEGGNLTVVNSGTISGGLDGGVTPAQSEAIRFISGTNVLELRASSTINGAVVANSAADTLRFGGSADATFNATNIGLQYLNFGVFAKTGSSHWTLTGTAGQDTPFTISDGILTLGSVNTLAASSDIIVNGANATFDIGANNNTVDQFTLINGSVTGTTGLLTVSSNLDVVTGSIGADVSVLNDLNKVGAGVATIETNSTVMVAANASVFSGRLLVNGALNNSNVQASGTGVIGGNGTINGPLTLNGGGTVDPGATVHGIGTLTVANQFNINAGGGKVHVDFNATANDVVAVNSVSLNPNSTVFVHYIGPGTPTANTPYTFLTSTAPLGGAQFGSIREDFPLVEFQLGYTANTAYFFFDRTNPIFITIAQTPNERAVANYLDQFASSSAGDFGFIVDNLLLLNASQARAALNQMSGEVHATAGQAGIHTTTLMIQQVANHLSAQSMNGPGGAGGPTVNLMAQATPTASPIQQVSYSDEIVLDSSDSDEIVLDAPSENAVVGWSTGYGIGGSSRYDGNASGANYGVGGFIAGVDRWLDESTLVGVFGGYLSSGFSTGTPSANAHDNAGYGGIYALRRGEVLYATVLAGGQADNYTTHRNINFGDVHRIATGNYDGWQGFTYGELGANIGEDRLKLQPFAALQYIHLRQNSISETGAGSLNLVSGGLDTDSLRSFLGTRLRYDNHGENKLRRIIPELQASWLHEYVDSSTSLSTRFGAVGGTNFNITGLNAGRDWAILGAGLTYVITDNVRLSANYYAQTSDRQTYHVGAGSLSFSW